MPRRIDAGELIAALGGLLVIIALFLDWYGLGGADRPFGATATGWEAFEALDLVLAGLALVALAVTASTFGAGWPLSPRVLVWAGALLVIIVAIQLAEPPPAARGLDRETGAWLALAGSLLVLLGGILRISAISITVSTQGRETRPRVAAVDRRDAAVDRREPPAPPPTPPPGEPATRRRSLLDDDDPQTTQPFRPVDGDT